MAALLLFSCDRVKGQSDDIHTSAPVAVTFGIRALSPDTPVSSRTPFVSQVVRLPAAVCVACHEDSHWERTWRVSEVKYARDDSQPDQGWYVFHSGLKGIGVSVQTGTMSGSVLRGKGMQSVDEGDVAVGLLRLARDTGAGLVDLPPAEFTRVTTFRGANGEVQYVQQDTLRVLADMRVPTCTSSTGSLNFRLPDISQVWLRRNVEPGGYSEQQASSPQLIVANCSENTRTLKIRFIPSGSVTGSREGEDAILVGRDDNGQDSGTGFLMKYDANAFGHASAGIVRWNRNTPLVLQHSGPAEGSGELTEGISVSLRAYYARPLNNIALTAGQVTAKGLYQISYE